MRRHISSSATAQPTLLLRTPIIASIHPAGARPILTHGRHRVLERTPRREMLSVADSALDFLILQLGFEIALPVPGPLLRFGFGVRFPVDPWLEGDVLAHAGGVEARAGGMSFLEAELRPRAPFGDPGVDGLFDDGGANAAGGFDLFACVVEAVGDYCFRAVFVGAHLLGGEGAGIIEFFVVSPVGATGGGLAGGVRDGRGGQRDLANLDIVVMGDNTWLLWCWMCLGVVICQVSGVMWRRCARAGE